LNSFSHWEKEATNFISLAARSLSPLGEGKGKGIMYNIMKKTIITHPNFAEL